MMQPSEPIGRLSRIDTHWTELIQAHEQSGEPATAAQQQQLLRYYDAVRQYMAGIVDDWGTAEELTQEFAIRFLRGDFKGADPERGRFRDFLKTSLRNLAGSYWRKRQLRCRPLSGSEQPAAPSSVEDDLDQLFADQYRQTLLDRTWEALARVEKRTGRPYYSTLRYKAEHSEARTAELGDYIRACLGKLLTDEGVRQLLHRAREQFADLLVEEVARTLRTTDPKKLQEELSDLELLEYCQSSLQRLVGVAQTVTPNLLPRSVSQRAGYAVGSSRPGTPSHTTSKENSGKKSKILSHSPARAYRDSTEMRRTPHES
jgi:RNA polymerase sigma-70 factor (ECF subfamily)